MKTLSLVSRICCFICVAFMLALIIFQFVPHWTEKEEGDITMAEMIWMPKHHKDLTSSFKKIDKNYKINDLVDMPILSMGAAAVGIFFCLLMNKRWWVALFPVISGGAMLIALTEPVQAVGLQYGNLQILSTVTVAIGALGALCGLIVVVDQSIAERKAFKKVKAAKAAAREAAVAARATSNTAG